MRNKATKTHGRFYCYTKGSKEKVLDLLKKVFGIVYISPALGCDNKMEQIKETALHVMRGKIMLARP